MRARRPAVVGTCYAADPKQLRADVHAHLGTGDHVGPAPKAIIAPHAGYLYSGPVAGTAFSRLLPLSQQVDRVVLIGPSHFVPIPGIATGRADAFETPLGLVDVDRAVEGVLERRFPQVRCLAVAHSREHSLEVELPFLQVVLDDFSIVALVVGDAPDAEVADVLDELWGGPETLIVVSSDLSHYLPYDRAQEIDGETAAMIEATESSELTAERACGFRAVNGLLKVVRERGLQPATLDLRNSGDTAGPRDSVVGYGAFAFFESASGP